MTIRSGRPAWTALALAAAACIPLSLAPGVPDGPVRVWWTALSAASVLNVAAWTWLAQGARGREAGLHAWLSGGFTLVCAYRSFVPRIDVSRVVLHDAWFSSVILGRSAATVAELCFVAQWALLLTTVSRESGSRFGLRLARALVPMIAVAECFSWYAAVSGSYAGSVAEESLWGIAGALFVLGMASAWKGAAKARRALIAAAVLAGSAYVAYMALVDVPMYASRFLADLAAGARPLPFVPGVARLAAEWTASASWDVWREETVWMSLYFAPAVWMSIALIRLGRPRRG